MSSHLCACHYGADGKCIWCKGGIPDKPPHHSPEALPPPGPSLGTISTSTPTYIPFTSWGRKQAKRSAAEILGQDLAMALGLLTEDMLEPLKGHKRTSTDPILGAGNQRLTERSLPKSGPWADYADDCLP